MKVSPPTEEGNSSEKGPLTTGAQTGASGSDKPAGSSTTAQPNKMMSAARQLSKGNLGNCVDQNYGNISTFVYHFIRKLSCKQSQVKSNSNSTHHCDR